MDNVVRSVEPNSPASRANISPGDRLLSINGHKIGDVLDYKYYSYERRLVIELSDKTGLKRRAIVRKPEGADPGLAFETYLMDRARSCANRCVFCFVDQLPCGMRETLYFKDDDLRLSFLQGNYITLTNLTEREVCRIIDLRISPINVSVHSTEPELRCMLLGNRNGGNALEIMRRFCGAGITMNCQIVCCPGINDGEHLIKSMSDLSKMFPAVNSVSVVPVGLTKHRAGLFELRPFDNKLANETLELVESYADDCLKKFGTRLFFCADELFLKAGRELPDDGYYEDYPQLENGVGMLRLLIREFEDALNDGSRDAGGKSFTSVTGAAAAPYIEKLISRAALKCGGIDGTVFPVKNDFFGHTIDVAGLVTGGDIIKQMLGRDAGSRILIPRNMLRHGESVFLDDVTVSDVSEALGAPVRIVEQNGADLLSAILGR